MRLSIGQIVAKGLGFLAVIYLARILGVERFGVLEFSLSILTYLLLIADGGLEFFGIRETAQGSYVQSLVSRILPLRFLMSIVTFLLLILALRFFPDYPQLNAVMLVFGLTVFLQAVNLKWVFMGRESLARVAMGLVLGQIIFTVLVFLFVRTPEGLILIPIMRLISEFVTSAYFFRLFWMTEGSIRLNLTLRGSREFISPALTMGASNALAMMSFNFDTVLLGFMTGAKLVGLYSAAYKPITIAVLLPVTYFLGLFPILSRTYEEGYEGFRSLVNRSLRLTVLFAFPLAVGGTFLAEPIIRFLFGVEYLEGVAAMRVLAWSAALVVMRGTFRQSLNAAGKQSLDLRGAALAVSTNVTLNLILIPRYQIMGAAWATLISEALWLAISSYYFYRNVSPISLIPHLRMPLIGGLVSGVFFYFTPQLVWPIRGGLGVLVYLAVLLLMGEQEVRTWIKQAAG